MQKHSLVHNCPQISARLRHQGHWRDHESGDVAYTRADDLKVSERELMVFWSALSAQHQDACHFEINLGLISLKLQVC